MPFEATIASFAGALVDPSQAAPAATQRGDERPVERRFAVRAERPLAGQRLELAVLDDGDADFRRAHIDKDFLRHRTFGLEYRAILNQPSP